MGTQGSRRSLALPFSKAMVKPRELPQWPQMSLLRGVSSLSHRESSEAILYETKKKYRIDSK